MIAPETVTSPFKGLAPFDDSDVDALLFFGRARESETIAVNLQASRLTVLYGPTGVGKSSVLRAGVAHRLRQESDVEVEIFDVWSGAAAAAVRDAVAARPDDGDLYLIFDQFEEYFVYHSDDDLLAKELAEILAQPALRVNVLVGIRDDALARLDAFKRRIPNLLANRLQLDRLDREAARTAILGPVERYNRLTGGSVEIELELVEAVLDEVATGRVDLGRSGRGGANGSTSDRIEAPFLQLVLQRLWEAERASGSSRLRLETLRRLGGAGQIVHDHLEHAMAGLTEEEKEAAAAMYDHLVTPSGTKIAHGVGDLAGYASVGEPEAATVLDKLVRERILRASSDDSSAATRYEIFHDVLADAVLAWRARYEEERTLARAHQQRRRALFVAAAALAGLVVVVAIAIFALVERSNARSQADRARAQELAAKAVNERDTDPAAGVRLADEAARLDPGAVEEDVLRRALLADRLRATLRAGGPVTSVEFSHDGSRELAASSDGKVRIYRIGSARPVHVLDQRAPVTVASFSPDDGRVLGGGEDGIVRLWDSGTGAPLRKLDVGGPVRSAVFGPRGLILTAAANGTVRVWRDGRGPARSFRTQTKKELVAAVPDPSFTRVVTLTRDPVARVYSIATGKLVRRLAGKGYAGAVAFSPDGKLLLTSDYVGDVWLWRANTLRLLRRLLGGQRNINDADWSRDGTKVAVASADGTARVWNVDSGVQMAIMIGHTGDVSSVAFSPDGDALVTTSSDRTARVWGATPADPRLKSVLAGHTGPVTAAVFSPNGRSILTAATDWTARLWDPGSEPELAIRIRQKAPFASLAASADGRQFAVADAHGEVQVRAADGMKLLREFQAGGSITDIAFGPNGRRAAFAPATAVAISPNGELIATAMGNDVRLQRSGTSSSKTLHPRGGPVHDLAFSPDGRRLAMAMDDATVQLWDAESGSLVRTLRGHSLAVLSVTFSRDGKLLATGSKDHDAKIWDVETGRPLHLLHGHFGPVVSESFSPDGRWLATAGPTTVGLWETSTGRRLGDFLSGPTDLLVGVAFVGRDGRLVVAASRDGTLRSYRCEICGDVHELLATASRRLAVR